MVIKQLSKLESMPLRDVWGHEAHNFTPWLAENENLNLLGAAIDIELELIGKEVTASDSTRMRVDILAKNKESDSKIIIENQLGKADHSHLGKLLVYDSQIEAEALIWVVGENSPEHQLVIRNLNRLFGDSVDIFFIKIELWTIDESNPAPRFLVIEGPSIGPKKIRNSELKEAIWDKPKEKSSDDVLQESDFATKIPGDYDPIEDTEIRTKEIQPDLTGSIGSPDFNSYKEMTHQFHQDDEYESRLSPTKKSFLEFWTQFEAYLMTAKKSIRIQSPRPQYYLIVNAGFAQSVIKLMVIPTKNCIRCRIRFRDEYREFYTFLVEHRSHVEAELDNASVWEEHASSDSILVSKEVGDVFARDKQEEYFTWLADQAILFKQVFSKYYQKFQESN